MLVLPIFSLGYHLQNLSSQFSVLSDITVSVWIWCIGLTIFVVHEITSLWGILSSNKEASSLLPSHIYLSHVNCSIDYNKGMRSNISCMLGGFYSLWKSYWQECSDITLVVKIFTATISLMHWRLCYFIHCALLIVLCSYLTSIFLEECAFIPWSHSFMFLQGSSLIGIAPLWLFSG